VYLVRVIINVFIYVGKYIYTGNLNIYHACGVYEYIIYVKNSDGNVKWTKAINRIRKAVLFRVYFKNGRTWVRKLSGIVEQDVSLAISLVSNRHVEQIIK